MQKKKKGTSANNSLKNKDNFTLKRQKKVKINPKKERVSKFLKHIPKHISCMK